MNAFILKMAALYKKIKNGTATETEKSLFEIETQLSCMDYGMLIYFIKRAAEE